MKLTLRALRLIALAVWVGGIVFFLAVANVAFKTMPDIHTAGKVKYLASRAHEGASLWRNYVEGAHPHCWSL